MSEPIVYRYQPREGAFITGLPQRDLTATDVGCVSPDALRNGVVSGLYAEVKPEPEKPASTPKPAKDGDR
ncbi:MAG: hypothetical protein KC438_12650 [Thermomicrobiales bacterium]|nr:hypothetical protein [Thermomicrobiales bacterium]